MEHYEVAGYTVAISLAKALKQTDVANLLNENLKEELAAAKALQAASKPLLKQAASEKDASENESEKKPKSAKEKQSEQESEEDEQEAQSDVPAKAAKTSKKK